MQNYLEENEHTLHTATGFLAGLLLGGLAGAVTALLMAPQSGQRTRAQIQRKSVELRDQATDTIEETLDQARATGRQISASVHKQAEDMQERGQALFDEQKERVGTLLDAGKKVVKGSRN